VSYSAKFEIQKGDSWKFSRFSRDQGYSINIGMVNLSQIGLIFYLEPVT
jgi:hypothetical protein